MNISEINLALSEVREAKSTWADRVTEFNSGVLAVMRRLLFEAAANRMSPEQVARASGYTPKRVRAMMRNVGLNPHEGKTLLSQKAAEALANNADLLGIEPREMDLMSPLAYLPMGKALRTQIRAEAVSQVHEDEEVSGNGYDEAKARIETALVLGRQVEDLPIVFDDIPEIAAWLASEGIR